MIDPVTTSTALAPRTQSVTLDQVLGESANPANRIEEGFASASSVQDSMGAEFVQMLSSYGNSILDAKQHLAEKVSAVGQDITPADLLSYQMDIYQISLQVDLTSKCVSKNNQNADTLLKAQ